MIISSAEYGNWTRVTSGLSILLFSFPFLTQICYQGQLFSICRKLHVCYTDVPWALWSRAYFARLPSKAPSCSMASDPHRQISYAWVWQGEICSAIGSSSISLLIVALSLFECFLVSCSGRSSFGPALPTPPIPWKDRPPRSGFVPIDPHIPSDLSIALCA